MSEDQENTKDKLTLLIVFFVIIITLWLLAWILLTLFIPSSEERGRLGDMFGLVNTLFSGLALAGIIFTILLQKKELALQRAELKLTRNELKRSAEAQDKTQEALNEQIKRMEITAKLSALTALVDNYNSLASGLKYGSIGHQSHIGISQEYAHQIEELLKELK